MPTHSTHDDLDVLSGKITFPDGVTRTWDQELDCFTRTVSPSPAPPLRVPRIEGGGTPKELAAAALAAGDVDLAASYYEQAITE